jgi:hypothetical protein
VALRFQQQQKSWKAWARSLKFKLLRPHPISSKICSTGETNGTWLAAAVFYFPTNGAAETKLTYGFSSATAFRSVPIPEISTSSTSPAFIQTGGVCLAPMPSGVPVAMMSPGESGVKSEQ